MKIVRKTPTSNLPEFKALDSVVRLGKKSALSFEKFGVAVETSEPTFLLEFDVGDSKGAVVLTEDAYNELQMGEEPNIPTIQQLIKTLKENK
jgi:hypothetical protein